MAKKVKIFEIDIEEKISKFTPFFRKSSMKKNDYDFSGLEKARNMLSNEKIRILHAIKYQKPKSIYQLAKILERDFKAVITDVKTLENFELLDLISEKKGKRDSIKPILNVDKLNISLKI